MTTSVLGDAFDFLINIGFLNTLVPFILFYAIVFGMLERTEIFTPKDKKGKGDESITNLHALIAFAIAITATAASQAVGITQNYLPILGVTAVVILGLMMLLGMAFGDKFDDMLANSKTYKGIVWGAALILIMGALMVVTYYSGLLVTPCDAQGTLTPVNSLNPGDGECTKLMDITGFPNEMYVLGVDAASILASINFGEVIAVIVIIGVIAIALASTRKKGG